MNEAAHRAMLDETNKQKLRPALGLIATFGDTVFTRPIGGIGL